MAEPKGRKSKRGWMPIASHPLDFAIMPQLITDLIITLSLYLSTNILFTNYFREIVHKFTCSILYCCLLFQKFLSFPSDFKRARGWKKLCRDDSHSLFLLCFSQISLHVYVRYYCGSHVIHRILKGIISIAVAFSL